MLNIVVVYSSFAVLVFYDVTVEHHPNMKGVVVTEVERLLFRPNIAERAQYVLV